MSISLPADFPPTLAAGLENVRRIHAPTWVKVVEFLGVHWGDLDAIDQAKSYWVREQTRARASINEMVSAFGKLSNVDTVAAWQGNAREAYAAWLSDFQSGTLDRYLSNIGEIIAKLDEIRGNIYSIRAHLAAMAIELIMIAGGLITAETVVGAGVAVMSLIACFATWADYHFRVKGDLDEKGRLLEDFRRDQKIDRGNGSVSKPFKTDIIGDWSNWQKKK